MKTFLFPALNLEILLLIILGVSAVVKSNDDFLYPVRYLRGQSTPEVQKQTVEGLLQRLLPQRAQEFGISVNQSIGPTDKDTFIVQSVGQLIQITGSSGIAAASGLHYYLKYYCGAHVSWSGDQLNLPSPLPAVESQIKITSNDRFRYYQNVCTASYSSVWWNWTRWEREIDWMALNGINLPLAFTGQEAIFSKVFKQFGLNESEINEFFTGPAFLAWNRMGNVQGWGGGLVPSWNAQQTVLQHKILQRMREFGMIPVLPAFGGHIPLGIKRIYPNASTVTSHWGQFKDPYGDVLFLQPSDPLFQSIGQSFLREYIAEFGTDHVYNTDLFNEMVPPSTNISYLAKCVKKVFHSMTSVDSSAIWVIQGWMFANDPAIWGHKEAKAFLTSVPLGRMIVLDLQSELSPQYQRLDSYFGQPFIWCMLHNFGGVLGLYGALENVNQGPFIGRNYTQSTMIGTGLTPEGIEQNDVVYEFMNEMGWRKSPVDLEEWITAYVLRRYGKENGFATKAWKILKRSVYSAPNSIKDHGNYILTRRPRLSSNSQIWFNISDVYAAWNYLLKASEISEISKQETYRYDLVDVSREMLQLRFREAYFEAINAYHNKSLEDFKKASKIMNSILEDLERILASNEHFLLGKWIASARELGFNNEEKIWHEFNARNQITLWGPNGEILDYATKQWSGVVSGYYFPRWNLFLNMLQDSILRGISFNETLFNDLVLHYVEQPFTLQRKSLPTNPTGDSIIIAKQLKQKYFPNSIFTERMYLVT